MRTDWICKKLDEMGNEYFREPKMNIVTIHSKYIPAEIALKYDLVPDQHNDQNKWYKIVIMDHVEIENLVQLIDDLRKLKAN